MIMTASAIEAIRLLSACSSINRVIKQVGAACKGGDLLLPVGQILSCPSGLFETHTCRIGVLAYPLGFVSALPGRSLIRSLQ